MIDTYIQQSRRTINPSHVLSDVYDGYYQKIKRQVGNGYSHPNLKVTYSPVRQSEIVKIGQNIFLVYDQYIGQTFNEMNKVLHECENKKLRAISYACKYIAENLITERSNNLAVLFSLVHKYVGDNVDKINEDKEDTNKQTRLALTGVQEIYVMAHEFSHRLFRINEKMRLHNTLYTMERVDEYLRLIEEETDYMKLKEIAKDMLQETDRSYDDMGVEIHQMFKDLVERKKLAY